MMLVRTVVWALLGAVLAGAAPPLLFPFRSSFAIEFLADPPQRIARGFYGVEQTPQGLSYAWTGETFAVVLPGLDRKAKWQVTVRLAASRADGTQPTLVASVNGTGVSRTTLPANGFVDVTVAIEPQPQAPATTTVAFQVTPTFVPGKDDTRNLGVQVDSVRLSTDGWWVRYGASLRPALVLGAVAGALAGALGVPALAAAVLLLILAAMIGLTLTQGFAAYVSLPWQVPLTGASIAAILSFLILGRRRPGASIVALISFAAVSVQLLLLSHPDMPLGDAIFQAHRFQDVLGGHYYFTSVAPGNYQFPYPIGLYLVSLPFSGFAHGELQNAVLLRTVVVVGSAVGASLLYCPVWRWREDEVAAVSAVAAYQLLPLGFDITATGNLTNMFGQAIAMFAFAMTAGDAPRGSRWVIALLTLVVAAAMLSHTSTFAVLTAQLVFVTFAILIVREREERRTALILLAVVAAAFAIAVGVYYGHFGDVYREAWTRITAETGRATEGTGGRTPLARLLDVPRLLELSYGWPILILALSGAIGIVRRPRDWSLAPVVIGGWLAACAFFLVVGIVTPVDLRHLLAALPAIAMLGAAGFTDGWRRGGWARVAVGLLAIWAANRAAAGLLDRISHP